MEEQVTLVGEENLEERKELISEMVAITQEDLPYLVLSYDPYLEAYNEDALGNVERLCPAETGEILCQQVSYEPLLTLTPGEGSSGAETVSGVPGGVVAIGALIIAIVAFLVGRARGRRETEPMELPT
jgi:hypothetical protein